MIEPNIAAVTPPLFLDLQSGLRILVKNQIDFFLYHEIFANREYAEPLRQILGELVAGPAAPTLSHISGPTQPPRLPFRCVDLGCNIGYFTFLLADTLTINGIENFIIEAVDGSSLNQVEYVSRIMGQKKPILANKVDSYCGLVGKKTGSSGFHEFRFHCLDHTVPLGTLGSSEVAYLDLDKVLAPGPIDLIKCDIEGSEADFLDNYGDLLRRTTWFLVELHEEKVNLEHCRQRLARRGLHNTWRWVNGSTTVELWRKNLTSKASAGGLK